MYVGRFRFYLPKLITAHFFENVLAFCILIWSKYIYKKYFNFRMSFFWSCILFLYILIHFKKSLKGIQTHTIVLVFVYFLCLFLFLSSFLYYLYLQYIFLLKKLEDLSFLGFLLLLVWLVRSCMLTSMVAAVSWISTVLSVLSPVFVFFFFLEPEGAQWLGREEISVYIRWAFSSLLACTMFILAVSTAFEHRLFSSF